MRSRVGIFFAVNSRVQSEGGTMKPLFILMALIISQSQDVLADSFSIVKDGKNYLCTSAEPRNPGAGAECASEAYAGPFSKDESMLLCAGASSTAPAKCAAQAYSGPCSKQEAISLCTRAQTTGPVDCFTKAYAGPFSKDESLSLCRDNGSLANADCALKAYAGPYSKAEALRLCKNEPQLMMRSLNLMQQSPEIQQKVMLMKMNIPALAR